MQRETLRQELGEHAEVEHICVRQKEFSSIVMTILQIQQNVNTKC